MSFLEAQSVPVDKLAHVVPDHAHSMEERRFRITGVSDRDRLLVVVVEAVDGDTARIISARRPMKGERHEYEDQ